MFQKNAVVPHTYTHVLVSRETYFGQTVKNDTPYCECNIIPFRLFLISHIVRSSMTMYDKYNLDMTEYGGILGWQDKNVRAYTFI